MASKGKRVEAVAYMRTSRPAECRRGQGQRRRASGKAIESYAKSQA